MNNILYQYLLSNYLKTIFKVTLIFYSFGIILNLFEEIEFLKNENVSLLIPLTLTALYIPSMIIKLLPFIIFISSMWFILFLRNNKDLLNLKVFGYSNFKIFFILASTSFVFGWLILFIVSPVTSSMMKYYEKTKSDFSRDIDHLISMNKNGLWIKENTETGFRIISSDETRNTILKDVTIINLSKNYNIVSKIDAETADISKNEWVLTNARFNTFENGIVEKKLLDKYTVYSQYDHNKITSTFSNFDTMSFLDLILKYKSLQNKGYSKAYLDQNLNSMLSLPFFLLIMTALASILTMNALKKTNNFTFIVIGLISCVAVYYFKDLSLALGQTNRITLSLSAWVPVVTIGLFSSIGLLQINEK